MRLARSFNLHYLYYDFIDTATKRKSMRIGVNSSAGAESEIQTKCMEGRQSR